MCHLLFSVVVVVVVFSDRVTEQKCLVQAEADAFRIVMAWYVGLFFFFLGGCLDAPIIFFKDMYEVLNIRRKKLIT